MSASPETRAKEDETLFTGQHITLTRNGRQMILESRTWSNLGFRIFAFVLLVVTAVIIGLVGAAFWLTIVQGGLKIALLFAVGALFVIVCAFWVFAASLFPRRFVFDFDSRTCTFSNVPGFGLTIPFGRIEAIDILHQKYGGSVLGLAHSGKSRRLRMHMFFGNKRNAAEIESQLTAIAEAMSKLLDRPVRVIHKATNRFNSWR